MNKAGNSQGTSLEIRLGTTFDGKGTAAATGAVNDLGKAARVLGSTISGSIGGAIGSIGGMLMEFFRGGIWSVAAQGVSLCWETCRGFFDDSEKRAKRAAAAIEAMTRANENMLEAIKTRHEAAAAAADREARASDAALAKRQNELRLARDLAAAEMEVARQRRIAAGEDPAAVNAEAGRRAATVHAEYDAASADAASQFAAKSLAAAEAAARRAKAQLDDALDRRVDMELAAAEAVSRARESAELKYRKSFKWTGYNIFERRKAGDAGVAAYENSDEYKAHVAGMKKLDAQIAVLEAEQKRREEDVAAAHARLEQSRTAVTIAQTRQQAAAAQQAAEERVKRDAESARKADEAHKKAADDIDKLFDDSESESVKAAKDASRKRIEIIKEETAEKIKAIDKELSKMREEAAALEQNAGRARGGVTFGEWQRGEREIARENARRENRQKNVVKQAEAERDRLLEQARREGRGFNPQHRRRLELLNEFLNNQDPKNNPKLKAAEMKEAERDRLLKDQKTAIDKILAAVEKGVAI